MLKDTDQPVASISSQMQSSTTSHWTLVRSFKKRKRTTGYLGIPHMSTTEAPMTENWDDDNDTIIEYSLYKEAALLCPTQP